VARGRADHVLVLAAVGVCRNWKRDLKECFGRDYILYDGPYLSRDSPRSMVHDASTNYIPDVLVLIEDGDAPKLPPLMRA